FPTTRWKETAAAVSSCRPPVAAAAVARVARAPASAAVAAAAPGAPGEGSARVARAARPAWPARPEQLAPTRERREPVVSPSTTVPTCHFRIQTRLSPRALLARCVPAQTDRCACALALEPVRVTRPAPRRPIALKPLRAWAREKPVSVGPIAAEARSVPVA